ncbi:MAG TPA: ATP-binding protein [Thermoanaerobaculia bacterium]|nr:ATP-binding protein [Thermoanaerobaculia bacterium]
MQVEVPAPIAVSARLAHELCRIVNESLSNAARHGRASLAVVSVALRNGLIDIRVADDGRGFAFSGRHDLDALERRGLGPRTLKERIRALGGSLIVESSNGGASIEVSIPVAEEG